jgi:DNA-binding NarL/FixJ family response regulator
MSMRWCNLLSIKDGAIMSGQATSIRVLIADDEPNVRQALCFMCEEGIGLSVVGAASDTAELLALVKTIQPDLLLLEWGLPGIVSSELMQTLMTEASLTVIVIGGDPEARQEALEAGAYAFIYKGDPSEKLLTLLQTLDESQHSAT